MAPVCFVVRDMNASSAPFMSFSASHKSREPFSSAPAIIPLGCSAFAGAHATSWNLNYQVGQRIVCKGAKGLTYLESVLILATGCSSTPCSRSSSFKSHSSSFVSSEKSVSTAPARVPVTTKGKSDPGDQANAAVRGSSLRRTILLMSCEVQACADYFVNLSLK
jgi:hypothetical protein